MVGHRRGPFVRWAAAGLALAVSAAASAVRHESMRPPSTRPAVHAVSQPSPSLLAHWGIGIGPSPASPPVVTKRQAEQFAREHLPFVMRASGTFGATLVLFQHVPHFQAQAWYLLWDRVTAVRGRPPTQTSTRLRWVAVFVDAQSVRILEILTQAG